VSVDRRVCSAARFSESTDCFSLAPCLGLLDLKTTVGLLDLRPMGGASDIADAIAGVEEWCTCAPKEI